MTDNEIIKALELCANRTIHSCKSCPCNSSGCACNEKLNGGALDLINRQNAEIERLENELHGKVDYIHEQREVIDDLKGKYNKKKITVECTFDKEQLEKIVRDCVKRGYELQINEIRNEAIREFAKLIKENSKTLSYVIYSDLHFNNTLDNLVKEMTEGENGYNS